MPTGTILAIWSDGTGRWIVQAFSELIRAVFDGQVLIEPRVEGVSAGGQAPTLTIVATRAHRLVPGAVAVIVARGGCFAIGSPAAADLRPTADGAATLADVRHKAAMRDVVHAIGVAAAPAVPVADVDARFEIAWARYEHALGGLAPPPTPASTRRRLKAAGVGLVTVAALLALAWGNALWPYAPPEGPCHGRHGRDRAECEWALFVERHSVRGSSGNVALATQLQHRPFAIVERRTGCGAGSTVDEYHLVRQGDAVHGTRIGTIAAGPPGVRYPAPPALTVSIGETTEVLAPWQCGGVPPAATPSAATAHAIRPRFIGALSPSDLCRSLQAVRDTVPMHAVLIDRPGEDPLPVMLHLLAGYLAASGAGPRNDLERRLAGWASLCEVR